MALQTDSAALLVKHGCTNDVSKRTSSTSIVSMIAFTDFIFWARACNIKCAEGIRKVTKSIRCK